MRNEFLKTVNPDKTIQLSQWVSTDKSQLVKEESEFDDFIENLVGKFGNLTASLCCKEADQVFQAVERKLAVWGVLLCVIDFAEAYSFLVHDAAQGFH